MNQSPPNKFIHIVKVSLFTIKRLLFAVLIVYAVLKIAGSYLDNIYYSAENSKISPDGKFTITQLHSASEGGHAPYGRLLVLSTQGSVKKPDEGYVIFAGYCVKNELAYS